MGNVLGTVRGWFGGGHQEEEPPHSNNSPSAPAAAQQAESSQAASQPAPQAKPQKSPQPAGHQGEVADDTVNKELFDNEYRRKAKEHGQLRKECYEKADEARNKGDHATANDYVNQAKEHTKAMEEANRDAVEYILRINPKNSADTIDLHGLRVEEAMEQVERKLSVVTTGMLHIIPGRGSHSENQQAKIKPKLITYLKENNYRFSEDNPGSISVHLS